MSSEEIDVKPAAFSTHQDASDFEFQKYETSGIDRSFYLGPNSDSRTLEDQLTDYYSLEKLLNYLVENPQYQQITLQFPDTLIKDGSLVTRILQDRLDGDTVLRKFWVLADTAYSACCVDEVAAEHVNGDLVIHFGDACLNAIQKLPVVYAFGTPYMDLETVCQLFEEKFSNKEDHICLMANASYDFHLPQLFDKLKELGYKNLLSSKVNHEMLTDTATILYTNDPSKMLHEVYTLGNRKLLSEDKNLEINEDVLREKYTLFHITVPQDPHLLYLSTVFNDLCAFDVKDSIIRSGPFPSLNRRYKNMHVARTAGCIGILVNTLSIRGTRDTVNKLIKLIRENGKKHYLFVVGKPNVPKLANFEPVDIWCILGCGQSGIIVDEFGDFYKPIITPYELTMAMNIEVTWTGKWVTDFQKAITAIDESLDQLEVTEDKTDDEGEDDDAPEFDAVTGKYVSTSRPLRALNHLQIDGPEDSENRLVPRVSGGTVIKGTVSAATRYLENRAWSGLGTDFKDQEGYEEEGATVEEGISGVARGYDFDQKNAKNL
ncbi:2-(3-amino-3-carboxypropyl)histidine synthase subunit 2 [Nakaseomyces bracarensis]|uniref:2-(3-amino-3-carboxypropyl)histidine synthase subunit 2 n=1 Tax=Nakaseomyces bracarensis TaxID=273131 RepID=A0ABR4NSV8_9SACH